MPLANDVEPAPRADVAAPGALGLGPSIGPGRAHVVIDVLAGGADRSAPRTAPETPRRHAGPSSSSKAGPWTTSGTGPLPPKMAAISSDTLIPAAREGTVPEKLVGVGKG